MIILAVAKCYSFAFTKCMKVGHPHQIIKASKVSNQIQTLLCMYGTSAFKMVPIYIIP